MSRRTLRLRPVWLTLAVAATACGGRAPETLENTSEVAEKFGENVSPFIQYMWRYYDSNPDMARASYAVGDYQSTALAGGCTAFMVGPNVVMTAAHCGNMYGPPVNGTNTWADGTMTFHLTRNGGAPDATNTSIEDDNHWSVNCKPLLQTLGDSDVALFYCPNNAAGIGPGDQYGYLNISNVKPTVGDSVYRILINNTPNPATTSPFVAPAQPTNVTEYCPGTITSITASLPSGPLVMSADPYHGRTESNAAGYDGTSGSPLLNATTHELAVFPASQGVGAIGYSYSSYEMFQSGWVPLPYTVGGVTSPMVNSAYISTFGILGSIYGNAWLDSELDDLIDVQQDIERVTGENRRAWYNLGFESRRRNNLWTIGTSSSIGFDTNNHWATMTHNRAGYDDVMRHPGLNLLGGHNYRVTFSTYATYASSRYVGFKYGGTYVYPLTATYYTPVLDQWQTFSFDYSIPAGVTASLVFGSFAAGTDYLSAVSVIRDDGVMDFDTDDTRYNWRNDIDGSRAEVVPDGRIPGVSPNPDGTTTGQANWAVRVAPSSGQYSARNRQLGLVPTRSYSFCFDARRQVPTSSIGAMQVLNGGTQALVYLFTPSDNWQTYCTQSFTPASADSSVRFAVLSGVTAYYVDNLTVRSP